MLSGGVGALLADCMDNPPQYDFKKVLTVKRNDVIDFLNKNTDQATAYWQRHGMVSVPHDAEELYQEGDEYLVAWIDHGKRRWIKRFKSLPEAIAEHVLVAYGMY